MYKFNKLSLEIPQSRKIELEGYKFKNDNVLTKVQQKCTGINKVNFENWEQSRNLDNGNDDDNNMGMR